MYIWRVILKVFKEVVLIIIFSRGNVGKLFYLLYFLESLFVFLLVNGFFIVIVIVYS